MADHPHVPHPRDFLPAERAIFTWINATLTTTLGSNVVFLLCFIVPLLAVPASETVKLVVGIVFSNWFQAWALPVLQKSSSLNSVKQDAKADADHQTFTHLATQVDDLHDRLTSMQAMLDQIHPPLT